MDSSASYRRAPFHSSSRSSYPTFIPIGESLVLYLSWAKAGLLDAFRWDYVAKLVSSDAEIRGNMLKSGLLNSLSVLSIWVFDWLVHIAFGRREQPNMEKGFMRKNIGWSYQILWLGPILGISLYLNSTWCGIIARRTFVLQHGNRAVTQSRAGGYKGMLNSVATSAYRAVMIFTCVIVSVGLGMLPIPCIGPSLAFLFFCWVDAYYCFEFVWIARGLPLSRRVRHVEERWAYYLAFGLPPAALCSWRSSLVNAAIFALVFPSYIIMATRSRPLPLDPYSPIPSDGPVSDTIRYPSPFLPLRLPIFSLIIWLNDSIVRFLSVGTRGRRSVGSPLAQTTSGSTNDRTRKESLDGMENVEEGAANDADEMQTSHRREKVMGRRRMTLRGKKLR